MDRLIIVTFIGVVVFLLCLLGDKVRNRNEKCGKRIVLSVAGLVFQALGICLAYALYDASEWNAKNAFFLLFLFPVLVLFGLTLLIVGSHAKQKIVEKWFDYLLKGLNI